MKARKAFYIFSIVITLIFLISFSTLASPISFEFDRVLLYGTYDAFGSGTIEESRMGSHKGFGIGFLIPVLSETANVGLEFSSTDYDDSYFEIQVSKSYKDAYLMRLNHFNYGDDGTITHFGAYNYQDSDMSATYYGGGLSMVCFDSDQNPGRSAYFSLYLEAQAQLRINENSFLYAGVLYDYHLGSTSFEVGFGSNL